MRDRNYFDMLHAAYDNGEIVVNPKDLDPDSIRMEDVDPEDHPDYSDAVITDARWMFGEQLSEEELEILNKNGEFVNKCALMEYT